MGFRRGFTLIESLVASVVLAVAVVGVVGTLSALYQQTATMKQNATASLLARQLMDEIAAKPFVDPVTQVTAPGHEAGETSRDKYNNIGDYDGWQDTSTGLTTLDGQSLNVGDGQAYTRSVSVVAGNKPAIDLLSPSGDFLLVTVTVTTPAKQQVQLSRLFTNVIRSR